MDPACRRCPISTSAFITAAVGHDLDGQKITVAVVLCYPCRIRAARENTTAMSRRTGKEV